jgi:transposase-like protein
MMFHQLLVLLAEEDACKSYLTQRRWPNGVTCPKCGNVKVWGARHRPFHWICKKCNKNGYRFSVITKTIFENTKYPLSEWFKAILILCSSKKGVSAMQIQRILAMGSYRTAWYMRRRIYAAVKNAALNQLTGGTREDG